MAFDFHNFVIPLSASMMEPSEDRCEHLVFLSELFLMRTWEPHLVSPRVPFKAPSADTPDKHPETLDKHPETPDKKTPDKLISRQWLSRVILVRLSHCRVILVRLSLSRVFSANFWHATKPGRKNKLKTKTATSKSFLPWGTTDFELCRAPG